MRVSSRFSIIISILIVSSYFYDVFIKKRLGKKPTSKKQKTLVAVFGVFSRSFTRTWPTFKKHIITPLQSEFEIEYFFFNIDVEKKLIDGVAPDNSFYRIIRRLNHASIEMELERDIDKYVTQACQDLKCRFRSDYSEMSTQNAFRQLYAEFRVSQYIRQHMEKYALIVALGSDFFFVKNFPIQSIKNINEETILLSDMNDAEGYTNGVYVGKPTPVIKVMSRFQNLSEYDQLQRDYERILLESVLKNNLNREVIDLPFCKKRANGVVYLGPKFPEHFKKSCLKSS